MFYEPTITMSLDALFALMVISAIAIASTYWWRSKRNKQARERFIERHDPAELRMNPHRVGLVYKVVGETKNQIGVVPVWDDGKPVVNGKEYRFDAKDLLPFDRARFVSWH